MNRRLQSSCILWLSICGSVLLAGCQATPSNYPTIQISRVSSGQAVEWLDKSQQPTVIQKGRLMGIDAPDLAQEPWGKQAKQRLEELIGFPGQGSASVEFATTEADKYGRKFVYLWKDGRLLNEQLLKDGWVLPSIRTANSATTTTGAKYYARFIRASQYARLSGEGIWNPARPMRMSPSEFRKEER
jgi:micrococcal nuclease